LIRPTSKVVERYLGAALKLMGGNDGINKVLLAGFIRLKTLRFDWMLFPQYQREYHRKQGRFMLDRCPTHLEFTQNKIGFKAIQKNQKTYQKNKKQ
jgi:hypothetical protein